MNLRKKSETNTTITLEWDPVPGAIGYRFQSSAQPKWSHTFDPARTEVKFSKAASYKVEALGTKDSGEYPAASPPPPVPGVSPPATIKADCSVDVTAALNSWLASVPNGSTISFPAGACYRIEGTLFLQARSGLIFEGNGCTFRSQNAMVAGSGERALWRAIACAGLKFRNMTLKGAYANGGVHDESLQWAHGIDLRGSHADIENVTMTDLAGDGVYFGLDYFDETTRSSGSVLNSTILRTGRNGVSVVAGNNILVRDVTTDAIGYIAFDVEPDFNAGPGQGASNVKFEDNDIGSYYLYAYALIENAPLADQLFINNRGTSAKGLRMAALPFQAFRPQRVTISGNTAVSNTQSPAMDLSNIDVLTVTNNNIPTSTLLKCASITGLTWTGNTPSVKAGCEIGGAPPPPPPPSALPFAEAQLRTGFATVTIPAETQSFTVPSGKDVLIDGQWLKRPQALKVWVHPGQRVHAKNIHIESIYPPSNPRGLSAYWRGGFGFRMVGGASSGAEHCSVSDCIITGPQLTDGFTIGGVSDTAVIQKVTAQRMRVESAALAKGSISTEPTEHTDAFQAQGPFTRLEFGLCTFYTNAVALPNHPGKCFMLNDYLPAGYTVDCNKVNFRDVPGLDGQGAFIIQDIREIKVNFTDCYALVQKSPGGSYQWQSGSSLFLFYGSSYLWESVGSAPNREARFPAASGFSGVVKEGKSPSGEDYLTRVMLGL